MTLVEKDIIKAYALENAIKHEGKANQGSVLSSLFAEGLDKSEIKDIMPMIQEVLREIHELTTGEQIKIFEEFRNKLHKREIREGLPELPNAENGKVIMRMAPFPSGPLHIGNARPLILNDEYVKKYGGKLYLVMDDTIGNETKPIEPEAYRLIEEDAKWLGINFDKKIIYKSDRIEQYYQYAEELLIKGYMYVCDCDNDEWKELKDKGIDCSCKHLASDNQIERWNKMKNAEVGSMCVRLKTSMQDSDPAFRDRVMFKISDRPHARIGTKYRVYPSMEFSWAIDDHVLGVTHVLRGIEHHMSTRVQDFIRNIFGWKNPESIYNGHLSIEGAKVSKSKGAREVRSGEFIGWNDPRLWSLQSLKDRGIKPETIREFVMNMGLTKSNSVVGVEILYSINKKHILNVPKYLFVEEPQKINITGCPELNISLPFHSTEKLGSRAYKTHNEFLIAKEDLILMNNENYRFLHLFNFKSTKISPTQPQTFSFLSIESNKELKSKSIQWVPVSPENYKVKIRMPNNETKKGVGEPALEKVKVGETIYLEKFGFVRLHKREKEELEFWFTHK